MLADVKTTRSMQVTMATSESVKVGPALFAVKSLTHPLCLQTNNPSIVYQQKIEKLICALVTDDASKPSEIKLFILQRVGTTFSTAM